LLLALLGSSVGSNAASAEPIELEDGVACEKLEQAGSSGETHECHFATGKHGKHDFTTRNGRAEYVFNELSYRCKELEILSDEDAPQSAPDAPVLRRVAVLCER
jgi:hypothetical protein